MNKAGSVSANTRYSFDSLSTDCLFCLQISSFCKPDTSCSLIFCTIVICGSSDCDVHAVLLSSSVGDEASSD